MDKVPAAASSVLSVVPKVARVAGCVAVGTAVGAAATFVIPAVVGLAGFTSAGITAGSVAAGMMSAAWKAGQGIWLVSILQSVGAAGVGVKTVAATGVAAAKLADVVTKKK